MIEPNPVRKDGSRYDENHPYIVGIDPQLEASFPLLMPYYDRKPSLDLQVMAAVIIPFLEQVSAIVGKFEKQGHSREEVATIIERWMQSFGNDDVSVLNMLDDLAAAKAASADTKKAD